MQVITNRDFYLAILQLCREHRESYRSLQDYLAAIHALAIPHQESPALSPEQFLKLLNESFTAPVPSLRSEWENAAVEANRSEFASWQATILSQIVDLKQMSDVGTLHDERRYFGIDSPRGARWYNFEPITFLEAATEGTFGGWVSGDESGRQYVPGHVFAQTPDGEYAEMEPQDVPNPIYGLLPITWEVFQEFLWNGQMYE